VSDFEAAKDRAAHQHAAWSAVQRTALAADHDALARAIKTGAVFNLTATDRDALINLYGAPPPKPPTKTVRGLRVPRGLGAAKLPSGPRQSWTKGEFAHAAGRAALRWLLIVSLGWLALEIYASWSQ
jgi:hypothetical protein